MSQFDPEVFLNQCSRPVSGQEFKLLSLEKLKAISTFLELQFDDTASRAGMLDTILDYLGADVSRSEELKYQERLKEMELERQKLDIELQSEREQREHDLKMKQLELRGAHGGGELPGGAGDSPSLKFEFGVALKLVPAFDEDEVDDYFVSFEKTAEQMEWPTNKWAILAQSKFIGRARSVYAALDKEDSADYPTIKAVVLSAYELTPDAYRLKFRKLKREGGQTYVEYARRQEKSFDTWFRSLKLEKDYKNLREVLLMEQFKRNLPMDVLDFLNEKNFTKFSTAAMKADEFEVTHSRKSSAANVPRKYDTSRKSENGSDNRNWRDHQQSDTRAKQEHEVGESQEKKPIKCYQCNKTGHIRIDCPELTNTKTKPETKLETKPMAACSLSDQAPDTLEEQIRQRFTSSGWVKFMDDDLQPVKVAMYRDTGAFQSFLLAKHVPVNFLLTEERVICRPMGDVYISAPLIEVEVSSELFQGKAKVAIVNTLPIPTVDFILGNDLAGAKVYTLPIVTTTPVTPDLDKVERENPEVFSSCAVTRSQTAEQRLAYEKITKPVEDNAGLLAQTFIVGEEYLVEEFRRSTLIEKQKSDTQLAKIRLTAMSDTEIEKEAEGYYVENGLLMRKWRPADRPANEEWTVVHQVVLPKYYHRDILKMAHDIPMSGHMGIRKTQSRIMKHFYWPGIHNDVKNYVKACHTCQMSNKADIKPAPLIPIPAFDEPFTRLLVDCVGPLPRTKSQNQYLLTIMDVSSRYPEAIPLKRIDAPTVVEALTKFFTKFGLPHEIQSDQGSNFLSKIFGQVVKLVGIDKVQSSAYHPESQGALERFHQTLKNMLRTYCYENPDDWDKGVDFVLFAAREVPNESTGFSPNELVFGHQVRGPLKLVKDVFLRDSSDTNLLDYVSTFKERLTKAWDVASQHLKAAQQTMKYHYDLKVEPRKFRPGEKVLVLLPERKDVFSAKFAGPYRIEKKLSDVNYVVATPDRRKKRRVCHVNMIKAYHERQEEKSAEAISVASATTVIESVEPVSDCEISDTPDEWDSTENNEDIIDNRLCNSQLMSDMSSMLQYLPEDQQKDLTELMAKHSNVFSDKPGCTHLTAHDIDVGVSEPIKQAPYRLNPQKREIVREEIEYMLDNDLIQLSDSDWSSPIVLVPKPDGTLRLCVNYKRVNAVSRTDCFPLKRIEDCIDSIGLALFVSKVDLMKGYWQLLLTERARAISAFVTPDGFYEMKRMPFGLKNAPATFQRLMNAIIADLQGTEAYIDDLIVYSRSWEEHLGQLDELFSRLETANLVVNLAKSEFAKGKVTYLGHIVGQGQVAPRQAKVECILDFPIPITKKELLRFLGMSGFYRKFCPNYSTVVLPLTNLLKKDVKFLWNDRCQESFDQLKAILANEPLLKAPDFSKPFKLGVDASDVGVGAVLMQEDERGVDRPIAYYSKKLDKHQRNYSTIEKETFALVLALQHFEIYTTSGVGSVICYTDHNPLVFLERFKLKSDRLFRWSLLLQPYSIEIHHIPGRQNVVADALSRSACAQ